MYLVAFKIQAGLFGVGGGGKAMTLYGTEIRKPDAAMEQKQMRYKYKPNPNAKERVFLMISVSSSKSVSHGAL